MKIILICCLVSVAHFETLAEKEKRLVCTQYPGLRQCSDFNESYQKQQHDGKDGVKDVKEKSVMNDDNEKKPAINDDDQEEPVINNDVQEEPAMNDDQEQVMQYEYQAGQELLKSDVNHHQAEVQEMMCPEPSTKDHGKESVMEFLQKEFDSPITQLLTGLLSAVILGLGLKAMIKCYIRKDSSEPNATISENISSSANVIENANYDLPGLVEVELGAYQGNDLYEVVSDSNIVQ
jgi:hypothetical protein